MAKQMDHNEYPKMLKNKSHAALSFMSRDAHEAIKAMPDGENVGYYQDEINYICMEQFQRAQRIG